MSVVTCVCGWRVSPRREVREARGAAGEERGAGEERADGYGYERDEPDVYADQYAPYPR